MEPVFTIPYSEYAVMNELSRHFGKTHGFSIYVPASRQEKGVDFLVHSSKNGLSLRFQVKGSRCYLHDDPESVAKGSFRFSLWFNNFLKRYTRGQSDYYVLFGLYPDYATGKPIDAKKSFWQPMILCFSDGEMKELLESVLTKEEKRPDRFFYVEFNSRKRVYGTRGFPDGKRDLTPHLLENQLQEIGKRLGA